MAVHINDEHLAYLRRKDKEEYMKVLALTKLLYRGDIKVGETVSRYTSITCSGLSKKWLDGVVTYVHPKHYFHTVEFTLPNGNKIRECFQGTARKQNAKTEVVE